MFKDFIIVPLKVIIVTPLAIIGLLMFKGFELIARATFNHWKE